MEVLALWYCDNVDRAKRKFHVCLGVSHEKECFEEIAAGLSYKAVGKKSFRQIRSDLKRQVTIKIHPQRLSDNRKSFNFDIGLVKLDRKVFFGPDLSPICLKVFFLMKFLVTELLRGSLPLPPWSSSQEKCSSPVMASPCTGDHRAYDLYTIEPRKKGSKGKEKPQCSTNQFLPRPFHACKVGDSGKKIRDSNKLRVLAKRKRQFQRLATTQGTRPFALGWSSTTLPTSTTILT